MPALRSGWRRSVSDVDPDYEARREMLRREFLLAQLHEHRARRAMLRNKSPEIRMRWEDTHSVLTAAAHEFYRFMRMVGSW